MREVDVPGIDLNLLGPLGALLQERHVSRAAARAHTSQPAMSRALAALRRTFDDELLVRNGTTYRLTPRAERLQRDLALLLPQLESLFAGSTYDPTTAEHAFRLAGTDYVHSVLGPPLVRRVLAGSPAVTLHLDGWHAGVHQDLDRGALDLAFLGGTPPETLHSLALFDDRYVCVVAADHPLARAGRITLEEYLACEHVVVDMLGGRQGTVETRLEALGRSRRARVTVSSHGTATEAVRGTALVATLLRRSLDHLADDDGLTVLEAPPELGTLRFAMAWHPRVDADPAHRWLRDTVRETAAALAGAGQTGRPAR